MSIFHKKEGSSHLHFDPEKEEPAVRKSICTGEMTVGFLLRGSKHFRDVQVVHSQAEVDHGRIVHTKYLSQNFLQIFKISCINNTTIIIFV